MVQRAASRDHAPDVIAAHETPTAEAPLGREDLRAPASGSEQVLVELDPDERQRVGRVVGVGDRLAAGDRASRRVERHADRVVGALLPVRGTGLAVRQTSEGGRGQIGHGESLVGGSLREGRRARGQNRRERQQGGRQQSE